MTETKWVETIDFDVRKVIRVSNIVGRPSEVEEKVNQKLQAGYEIGSTLLPWTTQSGEQVFVQQVVLYEEEEDGVTPRREN